MVHDKGNAALRSDILLSSRKLEGFSVLDCSIFGIIVGLCILLELMDISVVRYDFIKGG